MFRDVSAGVTFFRPQFIQADSTYAEGGVGPPGYIKSRGGGVGGPGIKRKPRPFKIQSLL